MISSKTLKVAAAAILGTLVGTSPANAVIVVGTDAANTVSGAVTYAKEAVTSTGAVTVEGTTYYRATNGGDLVVRSPIGIPATLVNDNVEVTYTYTGAVFHTPLTAASLVAATDATGNTAVTNAVASLQGGGTMGASSATFLVRGAVLPAAGHFVLTPTGGLAISGEGASLTIRVRNRGNGSIIISEDMFNLPNVIKVENVIDDTITPGSAGTTTVASGYLKFGNAVASSDDETVNLGSLDLALKSDGTNRRVLGGSPVDARGSGASNPVVTSTRVGFSGDLSFVEAAFMSASALCATKDYNLLTGTGAAKTWKTGSDRPNVSDLDGNDNFCIEADGETPIEDSTYLVTIDNEGISGAVFPAADMENLRIGRIERDAPTIRIPYFTTASMYNHRLILTNRTGTAVGYSTSFLTEAGVTATAGSDASGMLQANSVKVIRAENLVTLDGGSRTAVEVRIDAAANQIGVATTQVNLGDGSTDTVVYSAVSQ